jgi:histone deacetylase 1/2
MLLTQSKYIRDLLNRANMAEAKGINTPMVSSLKLSKFGTDSLPDPHEYRSIVGALQYVTLTRPEIAFSVNKVCQFLSNPLITHWQAVKRILRYLLHTCRYGLLLQPSAAVSKFSISAYSDSDWASDLDDRRSTSGSCIFFGPNLVSWSAKKQSLVARSSAEAEYRGLAHTTSELLWIQSLLTDLHIPIHTPVLLCDNISAVMIAHNHVLHARTKHLELDIHFVRERVLAKAPSIHHVPGVDQIADALTKPLPTSRFLALRDKLKVFPSSPPSA